MGSLYVVCYFVNEVLLVCFQGENTACTLVSTVMRVCVSVFLSQHCRLSLIPRVLAVRSGVTAHSSLLGNTRLQRRALSSSDIGWRSTVGGDLVTIYNLGSRVLAPHGVNQPAWWSTEPLQPVRGDAMDAHVHCCTADRLSLTKAANRQCVTQPQTA